MNIKDELAMKFDNERKRIASTYDISEEHAACYFWNYSPMISSDVCSYNSPCMYKSRCGEICEIEYQKFKDKQL